MIARLLQRLLVSLVGAVLLPSCAVRCALKPGDESTALVNGEGTRLGHLLLLRVLVCSLLLGFRHVTHVVVGRLLNDAATHRHLERREGLNSSCFELTVVTPRTCCGFPAGGLVTPQPRPPLSG